VELFCEDEDNVLHDSFDASQFHFQNQNILLLELKFLPYVCIYLCFQLMVQVKLEQLDAANTKKFFI